ncbi:MFS transporter [Algoriphagus sp. SE2]|uniref:MFS transporter n=1 Tax=Algoriphagus sp. SE2 TaxID=3141536 RepID=UPI0031CD672B
MGKSQSKTKTGFLQNRSLVLQVSHSFFTFIFVAIFFSVATIEFVRNFEKSFLPVGYLFSGVIGYALIIIYGKFFNKLGKKAFFLPHLFMLASASLFWVGFLFISPESFSSKVLSFLVYIFCTPFIYLVSNQQAGLLIKIYNIRESKEYSGIISSAGTLAFIVGYFSVPSLTKLLGSNLNLLWVAILGLLVGFFILIKIVKTLKIEKPADNSNLKKAVKQQSYRELLSRKFILFIAISGGISTIAYYFVDYSFLVNSQEAFKDNPQQLVIFIGYFLGLVKIFEFLLGIYSAKFFRNFGLKTGLVILPILCLLFVSLSILASFDEDYIFALAVFVFALKFFERIFKKSIEEPAYKNLYQILDPAERLLVLAKIEGGTKQISVIIGSLILIVYGWVTAPENIRMGILYLSLALFIVWVFFAFKLVGAFKDEIKKILEAKHIKSKSDHLLGWDKLMILINGAKKDISLAKAANTILGNKFFPSSQDQDLKIEKEQGIKINDIRTELKTPVFILPPKDDFVVEKHAAFKNNFDKNALLEMAMKGESTSGDKLNFLVRKFNEAKQIEEKRFVLNLIGRINTDESKEYLVQMTTYPDYVIKMQAYYYLEFLHYKIDDENDQQFWSNLENVLEELTYLISIMSSLPDTNSFLDLNNALKEEERILENRVLSLLTWKYDQASIIAIRKSVFSENEDNNLLALELFDNLLEMEIKEKILTLFNKSTNYDRLKVLSKWFYYPLLDEKKAIISILNSDYTKVGNWSKACALKVIIDKVGEEYFQIMKSFLHHPNLFLRSMSFNYFTGHLVGNSENRESRRILEVIHSRTNNSLPDSLMVYDLVKIMGSHNLFSKISTSELIPIASHAKLETSGSKLVISQNDNMSPALLLDTTIELKYAEGFDLNFEEKDFIGPHSFSSEKVMSIKILGSTNYYSFDSSLFQNLISTSDIFMGSLLADERGLSYIKN